MQEMTGGRTVPRVFVVQMLKSQIFNRPLKSIADMIYEDVIFFLFFLRGGVLCASGRKVHRRRR
jgi:hypothetical protein